jgi:hypothetical protein
LLFTRAELLGLEELNSNLYLFQETFPIGMCCLFFNSEIFGSYSERNQQRRKDTEGPLKLKSVYSQRKEANMPEIKLFFVVLIFLCLMWKLLL